MSGAEKPGMSGAEKPSMSGAGETGMMENVKAGEIRVARCPTCGKPAVQSFRPFCSKRCADVDLGRWFNGAYAVPAASDEEDEGLPPPGAAGNPRDLS